MAGGYDAHFVDPLADRFSCPICQLALRDPIVTDCGHQFCQECVQPLKEGGLLVCPICRTQLKETEIYPNNFLKREVLSLKIRCDQHKDGCKWIQELRDRDEHNKTCGHVSEQCTNTCGKRVMKKDMEDHLKTNCSKRKVPCQHCYCMMPYDNLDDHYGKCNMFPVSCRFQCGKRVARKEMEQHVSRQGTCPNSPLACDFREAGTVGCNFTGNRGELESHLQENMALHLSLVMTALTTTSRRLSCVEEQLAISEKRFAQSESLLSTTRVSLAKREHELDDLKLFVKTMTPGIKYKPYSPPQIFVYEWKINCTVLEKDSCISSNKFFTGDPGYCLFLQANHIEMLELTPSGQEVEVGYKYDVKILVCKGIDDDQLPKVCHCKVSFTVVDQQPGGKNLVEQRKGKIRCLRTDSIYGVVARVVFSGSTLATRCYKLNDEILIQFCCQMMDTL